MNVNIAATPSLESQELLHWLKALQALFGCPRCKVDASKPEVIRKRLKTKIITLVRRSILISSYKKIEIKETIIPYPVPLQTVKYITALSGFIIQLSAPFFKIYTI